MSRDILCWLNLPADAFWLRRMLEGMDGCTIDVDDAENIVIRKPERARHTEDMGQ